LQFIGFGNGHSCFHFLYAVCVIYPLAIETYRREPLLAKTRVKLQIEAALAKLRSVYAGRLDGWKQDQDIRDVLVSLFMDRLSWHVLVMRIRELEVAGIGCLSLLTVSILRAR
jgi:hypothetical protein